MAGSLNRVMLIGNVGKDPEVRTMQGGDMVANFTLATSESWKAKDGERQERTEWHKVVVWGKLAEVVDRYVKKGSKLYVQGQLQTRSWEKDGAKQYSTEVVLRGFGAEMILLSGKSESEGASTPPAASRGTPSIPAPSASWDDDMPF